MANLNSVLTELTKIEHGFKHIVAAGDKLLKDSALNHFEVAAQLLKDETYQGRMLGTYILGELSNKDSKAFEVLKTTVSNDENWRVQEILAKAFDSYAKAKGYENALPEIKEWLSNDNPNVVRVVTEGLRIWTSRPYFKENPGVAIELLSQHKDHESEYVRKSVGNALRDIRRKHADLVKKETDSWDLENARVGFTYKLVQKK